MSKNKWDQPRYQELIDLHKAISLLSLEQISSVLIDRLPSVFSIDGKCAISAILPQPKTPIFTWLIQRFL